MIPNPNVRSLLRQYHLDPHKGLGQNFLVDTGILWKIVRVAGVRPADSVLEIGAGLGNLTVVLAQNAARVVAVEIDKKLVPVLQEVVATFGNVEVMAGDMLKLDPVELVGQTNYLVVANIPYYITSPIIKLFLETEFPPTEMILMVQKEVAQRICAKPGEMSILAVSVQYYAKAELLFYVDKKAFYPVPEVDSAIIRVTHNSERVSPEERKKLFRVVKAGFSSRRKTLLNNLANSFHLPKNIAEEKIKKAGINPTSRAQDLNVDDWKKLSELFT